MAVIQQVRAATGHLSQYFSVSHSSLHMEALSMRHSLLVCIPVFL